MKDIVIVIIAIVLSVVSYSQGFHTGYAVCREKWISDQMDLFDPLYHTSPVHKGEQHGD